MDHEYYQDPCRNCCVDSSSKPCPGELVHSAENSSSMLQDPGYCVSNLPYLAIGSLTIQYQQPHDIANVWVSMSSNFDASCVVDSTLLVPLMKLMYAKWAQAEFKRHNSLENRVSIRVFMLPDDVGRSKISREDSGLRKARWELISRLDKSAAGWQGDGSILHPTTALPTTGSLNDSLLDIFNTLRNPDPKPKQVSDAFSRDSMEALLDPSEGISGLRSKLFKYQRRSAAIMVQREAQPAKILDPRFEQHVSPTGEVFYLDERIGCLLSGRQEYDEARGGILAETMGIGKTLICLALILSTKGHWPTIPPQYSTGLHPVRSKVGKLMDMAAATITRNHIPWKTYFENHARGGEHYEKCVETLRSHTAFYSIPHKISRARVSMKKVSTTTVKLCSATLVVVPANLLAQWKYEISLHIEEGFLSILVVEDITTVMPNSSQILQYDVILIERRRFEREIGSEGPSSYSLSSESTQHDNGGSLTHRRCHGRSTTTQGFNEAFRGCDCSWSEVPHSPLKCHHFLRLIVDEGHNFAASGATSSSAFCMQRLHVERRWVVSGTPANGLLGTEVDLAARETSEEMTISMNVSKSRTIEKLASARAQEIKDLKSLGNIVVNFLALPPWGNVKHGPDHVSWDWYVVPPKEGGQRNLQILRNVMESLIVRHRLDTVKMEIQLPQLYNRVVYLQPCFFDKLSINLFILKLVSNAITSERQDRDYMFHPSNRKQLDILINNLRKSCFFWTGFTAEDVFDTVQLSRKYIKEKVDELSKKDINLMESAIEIGLKPLTSSLWRALSKLDELGLYVSDFPPEACDAWSLTRTKGSLYTVIGATQLGCAVKFIDDRFYMMNPTEGLSKVGEDEMERAEKEANKQSKSKAGSASTSITPQKIRTKASKSHNGTPQAMIRTDAKMANRQPLSINETARNHTKKPLPDEVLLKCSRSALKPVNKVAPLPSPINSPLSQAKLAGTVSAKLSYLIDRVIELYHEEKILIFYEGDHIAYYIAQALELIGVQHLIYANSLEVARRNHYILTFTTTETFRVMLMDLRQAAHGLHVACASRVFFVNPVWRPNIEAQAIKRAHRIGQRRPVFVETLVLENTLEDQMLQRRKAMTTREQQEASKSLLDDSTMNDIIKNARFIPFIDQEVDNESFQFARLKVPQQLFGRKAMAPSRIVGFDDGQTTSSSADTVKSCHERGKKRVGCGVDAEGNASSILLGAAADSKRRKLGVRFAV